MKKFLISLLLTVVATSAMAVPAKRGLYRTVTLADGSKVKVQLVGDEFGHAFMADDGSFYKMVDSKNNYVELISRDELEKMSEEKAKRMQLRDEAFSISKNKLNFIGTINENKPKAGVSGKKKALLILVQFKNLAFRAQHTKDVFVGAMNTVGYTSSFGHNGSLHDYFLEQSNGKFDLTFDVVGPYTLEQNYEYYGRNTSSGDDEHPGTMVAEACKLANEEVNFADYDWDGDKEADLVFVLYAGNGEASSTDENTVWPHAFALSSSDYRKSLTLDGIKVDNYACGCELSGRNKLDGPGTVAHEFSHCIGYPDLYDIDYSCYYSKGEYGGFGDYDLMDGGPYNNNGFTPPNYSAYERMAGGWLTPVELSSEEVTVNSLKTLSKGGNAYIIRNPKNTNEYYMLENRQKEGWDKYIPGKGLMISYIDYNSNIWDLNQPNCQSYQSYYNYYYGLKQDQMKHRHCCIIPADNSYVDSDASMANDLWPYGSNNTFSNTSKPACTTYTPNTDGTNFMNIEVKNILANTDGTINFKFAPKSSDGGTDDEEDTPPGKVMMYESFNSCTGEGGNDNKWKSITSTVTPIYDLTGWTVSAAYAGNKCLRIGTSSSRGVITTPDINLNGKYVMEFKIGAWDGTYDGSKIVISGTSGITFEEATTVNITKGSWTKVSVPFNISHSSADEKITITIASGRFFMDEVKIYDPSVTGISTVNMTRNLSNDNRIFSIDGRFLGADINALPHGIYIKGGKKIVK